MHNFAKSNIKTEGYNANIISTLVDRLEVPIHPKGL